MKHSVTYAGISYENGGLIRFHTTGISKGKMAVWVDVPCRASFEFIKLPRKMDKLAAAKHLKQHKSFKKAKVQKFLDRLILRTEAGVPLNPRVTRTRRIVQRIEQLARAA